MLDLEQLCHHVRYLLHTPVWLFDANACPLLSGTVAEGTEDPLLCDPAFVRELLSRRKNDMPVFHYETDGVFYAVIPAGERESCILGPVSCVRNTADTSVSVAITHHLQYPDIYRITYVPLDITLECVLMLFHAANDTPLSRGDLAIRNPAPENVQDKANSMAYAVVYHLRENNTSHNSYAQETREQQAIRNGDTAALRRSWEEVQTGQIGRLGKNELSHYRNLAVTIIALSSRSAIEGGVMPEIAYSLADSYVMRTEELTSPMELMKLLRSAEVHFTELVHKSARNGAGNRHILRCKEIVHNRLHQRIRVADIASELGINRTYLSELFLKEEGIPLSTYIIREKLRDSEHLLTRSTVSLEQIAATYAFASQSHYGQAFRKRYGMSPGAYRNSHKFWE